MRISVISRRFCLGLCVSLAIFIQTANAFARPEMGGPERPRRGPEEIVVGHERYRYHDGRFFMPVLFGLFEVLVDNPPVGAVVTVLPIGHRTVLIGGTTYYYYDNIYYTACPSGYVVVPAPSLGNPNTLIVYTAAQPQKISGEAITINIPNSNGSYTPVTLVKQKDGYIGPQGEYYPGHPNIDQLKVLYGK